MKRWPFIQTQILDWCSILYAPFSNDTGDGNQTQSDVQLMALSKRFNTWEDSRRRPSTISSVITDRALKVWYVLIVTREILPKSSKNRI